ncbi:MAG: hypothetical protein ACQKBW_01975, partial [Puniceicoccales bacterium]
PPLPPVNEPRHKPEPARTKSFKLHPVSIVFLIIAVILAGIQACRGSQEEAVNSAEAFGYFVGSLIGAVGIPFLLSWLVWLISRRRRWPGNLVFCLVSAFMSFGMAANLWLNLSIEEWQQRAALLQQSQELQDTADYNDPTTNLDKVGQLADGLDSYGQSTTNEEEAISARVGAQFMRELQAITQNLHEAQVAYMDDEAVNIDVSAYSSPEQMGEARSLTQAFGQASGRMYDFYADLKPHLQQMYEAEGLSADEARKSAKSLADGIGEEKIQLVMQIHRTNTEYAASLDKLFKILQNDWDNWGYDKEEDTLIFENDDTLNSYNQLMLRLGTLEEKMALQQEQLSALK